MQEFPNSELIQRKRLLIADLGPDLKINPKDVEDAPANKLWRFESKNKTVLNITTNSLDMSSEFHKTYDLGNEDNKKFKCVIKYVVDAFLEISELPIINRIGLRYIDHCPLPEKNNKILEAYYNSKLPLKKFKIAEAESMAFKALVKKGPFNLGYVESLAKIEGVDKLVLDFDGSATDIKAADYLSITDKLHELITEEYVATIKKPVYDYMEGKIQ